MAKFIIKGEKALSGHIYIKGNKNAILPIMAASLLADDKSVIKNVPQIRDVEIMAKIIKELGGKVEGIGTNCLTIDPRGVNRYTLPPNLVKKLRASILFLAPLLGKFGKAKMLHPGGCLIGKRAVGTHFDALEALGVETIVGEEEYESKIKKLHPAYIFLDEASVTATENALMMASLIPKETIIDDAACEPHVQDLANFLSKMGTKIEGAGTNKIRVHGVKKLKGTDFEISPDYIDIGTFAIIGGVTKGTISISPIKPNDLRMILLYFQRMGLKFKIRGNTLNIFPSNLIAPGGKIQTRPWPGFPTDLMSSLIVLATQAKGVTLCHDWMYESRMFFVDKLITMGANITLCDPHRALISGPTKLKGKQLDSPDIRAGMALVVASLCASGISEISNIEVIERGYEDVEGRLKSLGAEIKRIP